MKASMLSTSNVQARKSNFELLRIFAMVMIIAHHFAVMEFSTILREMQLMCCGKMEIC